MARLGRAVSRRTRKRRARKSVGSGIGTAQRRRRRRIVAEMVRQDPAIRGVGGLNAGMGRKQARSVRRANRRGSSIGL